MSSSFELSIPVILRHEGGLVNDPVDPGGLTNFGISQRSYPFVDIKGLTIEKASAIYRRDYWDPIRCGEIRDQALALKMFDLAVNCGTATAVRMMQQAADNCGATIAVDGHIGPATIAAINSLDAVKLLAAYKLVGEAHYESLVDKNPRLLKFLKGWEKRVME